MNKEIKNEETIKILMDTLKYKDLVINQLKDENKQHKDTIRKLEKKIRDLENVIKSIGG
ncbi:MAG: hypothetical protein ACE5ES_00220 [Candidatus Nanoarchaeia archaeon]